MNKKGELTIPISIIIGILVIGLSTYVIHDEFSKVKYDIKPNESVYIADNTTKVAYNLNSDNPNCNIESILANKEKNLIFIYNPEDLGDYILDYNCD